MPSIQQQSTRVYRIAKDFEPFQKALRFILSGSQDYTRIDSGISCFFEGARAYFPFDRFFECAEVPYTSRRPSGETIGVFDSDEFLPAYKEGYFAGMKHFEDTYEAKINPFDLSGQAVDRIKDLYLCSGFKRNHSNENRVGWLIARSPAYEMYVSEKVMRERGFRVGVLEASEDFMSKYPAAFPFCLNGGYPGSGYYEKFLAVTTLTKGQLEGASKSRVDALALSYRLESGEEETLRPVDITRKYSPTMRKYWYTFQKGGTYKESTPNELEGAIKVLESYPRAQKAAINDLEKLKYNL